MNNGVVTTGIEPLIIGADHRFQLSAFKDGQPWNLTGGSAWIRLTDPTGVQTEYAASVSGFGATFPWTVPLLTPNLQSAVGDWLRAWRVDAGGIEQISQPIPFSVTA